VVTRGPLKQGVIAQTNRHNRTIETAPDITIGHSACTKDSGDCYLTRNLLLGLVIKDAAQKWAIVTTFFSGTSGVEIRGVFAQGCR